MKPWVLCISLSLGPKQVIPTHYKGRAGEAIRTNRISVTERFKPLHKEGEARLTGDSHAHNDQTSVLPGVFFIYDLSPFNVEVSTVSVPFSHFLVKVRERGGRKDVEPGNFPVSDEFLFAYKVMHFCNLIPCKE